MTLLQLSYFVALAENLHYTKTAEQLHISQPSLSYAISGMEKDLGVKLFVKDRQGVALSHFGREYYPYAKRALESLESGRRIVTAMTHYADTVVRLGYFHSIAASLVPALIHSFNDMPESSNIRFQLIEDSVQRLMADLYSGELDLCFSSHPESWADSVPVEERGDVAAFGKLLFQSHESSRTLFENSCPELDTLVEIARSLPGCAGARLSGGGFGGISIHLVQSDMTAEYGRRLTEAYRLQTGKEIDVLVCSIGDGARLAE